MGLGKTRLTIELARQRGFTRVLVLGPAIGRPGWPAEQRKWDTVGSWTLISWSEISLHNIKWRQWIRSYDPQMIVLDEAHAAKSRTAKRTRVVYGRACDGGPDSLVHGVPLVLCLSGTPAPNFTSELWTHLNALAPSTIIHHVSGRPLAEHQFRELYSHQKFSPYGVQVIGSKNTPQLRERTRSFFRRLRKEDVLADLPPLMVVSEPLTVDITTIPKEFRDPDLGSLGDDELLDWLNHRAGSLAGARRLLGMAKLSPAVDWIENFLDSSDKKLVVFAHHLDVIDDLARHFRQKAVHVKGSTSTRDRGTAIELFQNKPVVRVFIGQTLACGTAITLTAAHDVVVVEPDWTPANVAQAIARTHRIGQKNAVLARVLHVPETLDEVIAGVVARKAAQISLMFDAPSQKEQVA